MSCVVCNRTITNDQIFYTMKCGNPEHIAHGDHGTRVCPMIECNVPATSVDAPIAQQQQQQHQVIPPPTRQQQQQSAEEKSRESRRVASQKRWREPLVHRRDRNFTVRVAGSVLESISRAMEAGKPDEKSSNPMVQLKAGVSLHEIVDRGNDITEFINDYGATINDFFSQGWTLDQVSGVRSIVIFFFDFFVFDQMCDAFGSRMNPHEGMEVLKQLQITPEHFKFGLNPVKVGEEVRQYMTIECLVNRLGYRPECMIRDFGFEWTPQWSVSDMINLGINIEMAVQCGMRDPFQWRHTKAASTPEQLAAFLWTPEWDALLTSSAAAPVVQHAPLQAPLYAQPVAPQMPIQQQQQQQQMFASPQQQQQMFMGTQSAFSAPVPSLVRPPPSMPGIQMQQPMQQQQAMMLPVIHQVVPMQDDGKRRVVQAIQMSAPLPMAARPVNANVNGPKLLPYPRYK
jgi:hypothetical protein